MTKEKILKSNVLFLLFVTGLVFLVYSNLINGEFLNLDDINGIVNNKPLMSVAESLKLNDLTVITESIVVHFFGMNPHALHITSIVVHIINCFLVFALTYLLFGRKVAIITTLLFLAQPVNTESLGWLTAYGYILRAVLTFTILIFFILFKKTGKIIYLAISSAVCLFSLYFFRSQGWMFVTPLILMILDQFILEDKIKLRNIKYYLPYLVMSIFFAAQMLPGLFKERVVGLNKLYYVNTSAATPLINRIPYTTYMAFGTMAFPKNLSVYHEGEILTSAKYALMIVSTVTIIFAIFYFWKRNRKITGFILIIFFSILPSFSPIIIAWTAAERYLYVASAFFSMMVAFLILWIQEKKNWRNFALIATAVIFTTYAIRTYIRDNAYINSKNLWFATRITSPYSYRVYNNMGDVYASEGNQELALENFKRSLALKPDYADAVHNIGATYLQLGDIARAKKYLEQSVAMNPLVFQAWWKLGYIAFNEKNYVRAKECFEKVLEIKPGDPETLSMLDRVNAALASK